MLEVRIEASPEELADLRKFLLKEMGNEDSFDLQEISSVSRSGELREAVLISLIIALGGPAVVGGFVAVVKRWLEHREKMKELAQQHKEKKQELKLRFALLHKKGYEQIALDELLTHANEREKQ